MIVSTRPSDGQNPTSLIAPVEIQFSDAVDVSSLADTWVMRDGDGAPIRGVVSSMAPDTLLFTQAEAFPKAQTLTVALDATETTAGVSFGFTTFDERRRLSVSYLDGTVFAYRESPSVGLEVGYEDPGADGAFFTADDPIDNYTQHVMEDADDGQRIAYVDRFTSAGVDGEWMTPDDGLSGYQRYIYDGQGRHVRTLHVTQAGPDGDWHTADDVWATGDIYNYDGDILTRAWGVSPGSDGVLGTTDDTLPASSAYWRSSTDDDCPWLEVWLGGADAIIGNEDDIVLFAILNVFVEASDGVSFFDAFGASGQDGVWCTDDDVLSGYSLQTNNEFRQLTQSAFFFLGPDGLPQTPDDIARFGESNTYDANGVAMLFETWEPGPDGLLDTDDDIPSYSAEYEPLVVDAGRRRSKPTNGRRHRRVYERVRRLGKP